MSAVLRRCLLLVLLAPLTLLLPSPASADPGPGLSPQQARTVLRLVDDMCGDTWCEGDFAYTFDGVTCRPAADRCGLRVHVAWWGSSPLRWYRRTAQVRGVGRYQDMVTGDGTVTALRPEFVAAVGDALDRVEATVPQPRVSRNSSRLPTGSAA